MKRRGRWFGRGRTQIRDSRWVPLRIRFLKVHPLCLACTALGEVTPATTVDHIVPVAVAPDRLLDVANLRALCRTHHDRRTRAYNSRQSEHGLTWFDPAGRPFPWWGPLAGQLGFRSAGQRSYADPPGRCRCDWCRARTA